MFDYRHVHQRKASSYVCENGGFEDGGIISPSVAFLQQRRFNMADVLRMAMLVGIGDCEIESIAAVLEINDRSEIVPRNVGSIGAAIDQAPVIRRRGVSWQVDWTIGNKSTELWKR